MFNVSFNNIIQVNRGDSFTVPLFINTGDDFDPKQYVLQEGAEVYVGVMEPNQAFENAIIRKKYTHEDVDANGNINIVFDTNDTVCLIPGLYYYQIKIKLPLDDGSYAINTIVQKTQFYILG